VINVKGELAHPKKGVGQPLKKEKKEGLL